MIIFGWGHQTIKNLGPTFRQHCSHCNNGEYWVLTKITTWFTLFFIPIFPYSIKYFLSCPICQYGLTLDDKQIERIKSLAEANQLLIDGKITEPEYKTQINQLEGELPTRVEAEVIEKKPDSDKEDIGFCSECGTKITKEIKFCGNCGMKISEK